MLDYWSDGCTEKDPFRGTHVTYMSLHMCTVLVMRFSVAIDTDIAVKLLALLTQVEEEGVPSTALREVSLLQMLSESNYVVQLLNVEHKEEDGRPMLYLVRSLIACIFLVQGFCLFRLQTKRVELLFALLSPRCLSTLTLT